MALDVIHALGIHQLVVSGGDGMSVNRGQDALAAYLADVTDTSAVNLPAVRRLQALAYRVRTGALGQGGKLNQRRIVIGAVMYAIYLENAARQCAGLIKYDHARLAERLQVI